MARFTDNTDSIVPVIERLEKTKDVREAVHLLHDLGDLDIGREPWGYADFEREVESRFRVLMRYGSSIVLLDVDPSKEDKDIQIRARKVLCGLLRCTEKRGQAPVAVQLSSGLILEILDFFKSESHIPLEKPQRDWVRDWLLCCYASLCGPFWLREKPPQAMRSLENINIDYERTKSGYYLPSKQDEIYEHYTRVHKAMIPPLIYVGELSVFLEQRDTAALNALQLFARRVPRTKYAPGEPEFEKLMSLEQALLHKRMDVSHPRFVAAAVAIALRYLKSGQVELELGHSGTTF